MGTAAMEAAGTLLGIIPEGEILAGWEIIATGDGGQIAMKSGSCWSRHGGWEGDAETAWDAVTARLWARTSDQELADRIDGYRTELRGAEGIRRGGIKAAMWACLTEQAARAQLRERGM